MNQRNPLSGSVWNDGLVSGIEETDEVSGSSIG